MIGAILGDIIGSPFEMWKLQPTEKNLQPLFFENLSKFTDDTVMTIATADAILNNAPYERKYVEWFKKYPNRGYGSGFYEWAEGDGVGRRDSYGNGAAMRVSPFALLAGLKHPNFEGQLRWVNDEIVKSIEWTHNCNESEIGAKALVIAMMLARRGEDKEGIQAVVETVFDYDLSADIQTVRDTWGKREVRCSITVPQALICFLQSDSVVSCIQNAIWTGGDCDTIASMAAAVGEQFYGIDSIGDELIKEVKGRVPDEMWQIVKRCYHGKLNKYD